MEPQDARWDKLHEAFTAALGLSPTEQQHYLDRLKAEDPLLAAELAELLGVHGASKDELLRAALSDAVDDVIRDQHQGMVGRSIGAYRLLSILGEGGAGTVYLGTRADDQYSAYVAVKIVRSAAFNAAASARFEAERQILANLDHANIARLLDAGEIEDGSPYLVMEYVQGKPIDQYCSELALSVTAKLELFLQVCAAVQHAHRNLIVHGDLKPANILVTLDGTPKLLDFGIANLVTASDSPKPIALTHTRRSPLTPDYASPEQLLGHRIATTSDAYSLGIVLYELLTGKRPYRLEAGSSLELEQLLEASVKPSQAVRRQGGDHKRFATCFSDRRISHQFTGDIDAIVMRALRIEPQHRYLSVEQLAADVKRHLRCEPVHARRGNWLYYTSRFSRRHALGVGTAALASITLLIAGLVLREQNQRIAADVYRALQEQTRAKIVSKFMLDVFAASDPFVAQGREVTARELLEQAAQRIRKQSDMQPEVRARLLSAFGQAFERQSQSRRAIAYLREALQTTHDNNAIVENLISLGAAQKDLGELEDATSSFVRAKAFLDTMPGSDVQRARLLVVWGSLEHMRGNTQTSEIYLRQALDLFAHASGDWRYEKAQALVGLSQLRSWEEDFPSAEHLLREAVEILQEIFSSSHPDRVGAEFGLADVLLHIGKISETEEILNRVLTTQRSQPEFYSYDTRLSQTLDTASQLRVIQGRYAEAVDLAREALTAAEVSQGNQGILAGYCHTTLAIALIAGRKYSEAEKEALRSIDILKRNLPPDHQYVSSAEHFLARVYVATDRAGLAEKVLTANMERWRRAGAPDWRVQRSRSLLGEAQLALGERSAAERNLIESYAALLREVGPDHEAARQAKQRLELLEHPSTTKIVKVAQAN